LRRTQGSRDKRSKNPRVRVFEGLLRDEPRGRATALVGEVDPAGVEPDPAVVEVEDRRVAEATIGSGTVLVTGAVNVQLFPLNEPLGMRQDHAPRQETPEAELVGVADDLAHPSHGPTPMGQTELSRDQQKVALLLIADHLECYGRPLG